MHPSGTGEIRLTRIENLALKKRGEKKSLLFCGTLWRRQKVHFDLAQIPGYICVQQPRQFFCCIANNWKPELPLDRTWHRTPFPLHCGIQDQVVRMRRRHLKKISGKTLPELKHCRESKFPKI
jgi:hypothetical protein